MQKSKREYWGKKSEFFFPGTLNYLGKWMAHFQENVTPNKDVKLEEIIWLPNSKISKIWLFFSIKLFLQVIFTNIASLLILQFRNIPSSYHAKQKKNNIYKVSCRYLCVVGQTKIFCHIFKKFFFLKSIMSSINSEKIVLFKREKWENIPLIK